MRALVTGGAGFAGAHPAAPTREQRAASALPIA